MSTTPETPNRWPGLIALSVFLLIALAIWAAPRRTVQVVRSDGVAVDSSTTDGDKEDLAWREPYPAEGLLPAGMEGSAIGEPRLANDGMTLYCTVQPEGGSSDVYRSEIVEGKWLPLEPVSSINTPSNERGAWLSHDGDQLYFCSDREGGIGGFDLYVASLEGDQWANPTNLGARLNTAANEFDPSVSADGGTLLFASNRTRLMSRRAARARAEQPPPAVSVATGRGHTDLYFATREAPDGDFSAGTAITEVNRVDADERSPSLTADGQVLLFASNRSDETEEVTDFDVFAATRGDEGFLTPSRVDKVINTSADDIGPAVRGEEPMLVYASDRGDGRAIYFAKAVTYTNEATWDTANLELLSQVWPWALLITLGVLGVVFAGALLRGWFAEAASSAKFFAASFIFHLGLVLVLAFWSLPTVIEIIVTKVQEAEAGTQPFDDNQHQSHEDGQQAWEKLADLTAPETTVNLVRRETEPINIPNDSERLEPTITVDMSRLLPTDRVLYSPPPESAVTSVARQTMPVRAAAATAEPVDVSSVDEPAPVLPSPTPEMLENNVSTTELARSEAALDRPTVEPARLRVDRPRAMPALAVINDIAVPQEPDQRLETTRESTVVRQTVEITDDASAAVVPIDDTTELPVEKSDQIQLSRALPAISAPAASQPAEFSPPAAASLSDVAKVLDAPTPVAMPRELIRASNIATTPPDLGLAEESNADAPNPTAPDLLDTATSVQLNRSDAEPPRLEVPTPRELTGPDRDHRRMLVGELADSRVDLPPQFGPIVSQLQRPRAKAKRVVYAVDSVGLREMFTLRQSDIRKQYIELFDGSVDSEKAVNHGLVWLATHQNPAGSWSLHNFHANCDGKHAKCGGAGNVKSDCAATGLALLPFLAAGNTHQGGEYQSQVSLAINWFSETQQENGSLMANGDQQTMYSHSIATIALCEAYGMTGDEALRPTVDKALDFIIKGQHGGTGGWRYNPNEAADTSVVGWAMMALKSGEMAGIPTPQPVLDNVARWLAKVEGNKPVGGLFGYQNASPRPAMTAEGLLCLQFMGASRNDPRMRAGADYLLANLPDEKQSRTSYYWYYGTQVMYHMQGEYWRAWNDKLRDHLVKTQVPDGQLAGTWNVTDSWEKRGGRLYATAVKLLILEVYYRHLPLYEQLED